MLNREIVSFRSGVRTRGLVAYWNWISKGAAVLFPFPFWPHRAFPFPFWGRRASRLHFPPPPNLLSNFSWAYRYIYRRLGGAQPGNRFVSFVRAYARSGCLVELDQSVCGPAFSLFPLGWASLRSWGFSFVGPGGPGELSLFPFGLGSFPFSLPPPPKPPIQL